MADIETNLTATGIAAALIALKEIGMGIWKALRKGNADRKAERAADRVEARAENAERDQWTKISKIDDALQQHRLDDAQSFAKLETKVDRQGEDITEIKSLVRELHKRSTGKVKGE